MRYKNLFSFGVRMLFLAPNGCKGSYFLRYLSIKKEKSEKKFGVFKKYMYLCTRFKKSSSVMALFKANRDVAQLVSVHVWGACGRQFESDHPDRK